MKKFTAMLLCLMMVLALVGCGAAQEENGISALYAEGYAPTLTSYDESSWAGVFQKDDSSDSVLLVKAAMTSKQYNEYSELSFADEDYDAKQLKLLSQLTDVTVTDITDKVPSQAELDSYAGKTMGELENAGFEKSGYMGDPETGYTFFFDGPVYSLTATPENSTEITDLDDYSENDLRALTIESVKFSGFSFNILG